MWKLVSAILLALTAIVSAIEVGEDNGDKIVLPVPAVKQWGRTHCAAAVAESLLRYVGLTARDLIPMNSRRWIPEQPNLPMQSMLLNAMNWNHLRATEALSWRRAVNDILEINFDMHGGRYEITYYNESLTQDLTIRDELASRINRIVRTSLRYNMPVALGIVSTAPLQNDTIPNLVSGHLLLIYATEGRYPQSPITLYGIMDPAVPAYYGVTANDLFFPPGRTVVLIHFDPHGATSLRERRSVSDVGYSFGQSYMRNNFDCPQFRRPRGIHHDYICPTIQQPFWESSDKLCSYNLPNGTEVCDLFLDKSTAAGILYQKTEQSIQEYIVALLISIKWVSINSSKARDITNVVHYIKKNFNYFIYKVIKLIQSQSTYQIIRIIADFGGNFNPRKNIYLMNENKIENDIEYDFGEELIREKFDCYDNDKIIGDRNEFRKKRSTHGSLTSCPTIDHPYWENEDNLHSYYNEAGVDVCEVQLHKFTALGIVYQKEETFSEYLDKVIKGIKWTSELNEKNHDSDAKDIHDYIKESVDYFRYKFYELMTTNLSYTSIKVRINCKSTILNPEEAMYLL